jgi:Zn-dependent protease
VDLTTLVLAAPILFFSVVAHEWAHGYAAFWQGDETVQVTWDPRPYIDPVGTIIVPIVTLMTGFPFGWAKSWPFDPRRFRHFKRGDIIVSLAGVTANAVLALLFTGLVVALGYLGRHIPVLAGPVSTLQMMCVIGIRLNLVLAVLNLLPLPPMDGSHVMKYLLPARLSLAYQRIGGYGFMIFFALITIGRPIMNVWMSPAERLFGAAVETVRPFVIPSPWTL